jgi:hypothetical protein
MIIIVDDTENSKIPHITKKDAHTLEIMVLGSSDFIVGNQESVSIHQILLESYLNLFQLEFNVTKTLRTENCTIIDETFPKIYYGENLVNRDNINYFLKEFTNIDKKFKENSKERILKEAKYLENLILTDLNVFLGVFLYSEKKRLSPFWKIIFKTCFMPIRAFQNYRKEKIMLHKFNEIFSVTNPNEIFSFIIAINKKMEDYLELVGGEKYCLDISDNIRELNSLDLLIYSAYKAEMKVFHNLEIVIYTKINFLEK